MGDAADAQKDTSRRGVARRRHRPLRRHPAWVPQAVAGYRRRPPVDARPQTDEVAAATLPVITAVPPSVTLGEACALLGISPYVLRRLLEEFADMLPPPVEIAGERRLETAVVGMLATLVRWRGEGLSPEEMRRRMRAFGDGVPQERQQEAGDPLRTAVDELRQELKRTEHKQAEDRDRLLTLLMRTNQELQQLRHELSMRPRRERRRGFWQRLFK